MGFGEGRAFPNAYIPPSRTPSTLSTPAAWCFTDAMSLALAWAARYLGAITSIADCFGGGLAGPLFFGLGLLFDH